MPIMAFGMRDIFKALPIENGWGTVAPKIENEIEKKKLFGIELAKNHSNAFEAALSIFIEDTATSLWVSQNWLNDPEVIASRDLYANTVGVKLKLLDKNQTALKLLQIAEEKVHGRYLAEAKDRLKALELYAKICGYLNDTLIDNSTTVTNNEMRIVLVKPQEQEEQKVINVTPVQNDIPPVSIKLVHSA